ncbi:MAG: serine hydrolase [Gemmatimonadetes bacterium]|nr:MAG: serine hydrolase [Gemmatimonadota bacterium]
MNVRPVAILFVFLTAVAHRASAQTTSAQSALPRSTPEAQGISSSAILSFVQAADTGIDGMNSFMVVRHGHVVAEGWWSPYDAPTPHVLYSLSKSFTSTAVGLAIAEGRLSLDDEVLKFFPGEAPTQPSTNLRAMRVRDLLRMNTGHQTEPQLLDPVDSSMRSATWVKRFFAHPVAFKPGTHFLYNSPATYMLSAIVQRVTGQTVLDYLQPRLFEPLGIERPTWVQSPEGINAGAYGLSVRTEDIARLGQLYLQKGQWNGKQLIPAAWVDAATSLQTSNGSSPRSDWDQGYGYQFWQSRHGYRGDGAFGQYMLILPQYDAVVAITSGVRDMQSVMNLVWDKLLPEMQGTPLPENTVAQRALTTKLAGLTMRTSPGSPTSPLASTISGRWYALGENARGIRAVSLDLTSKTPALVVRTASQETRTPLGLGTWMRNRAGFANGIERMLSVPEQPQVAASGAWTADSVFRVKLVAPETPFYSTLDFRFDGDRLVLDGEQNVSFGPTKLPRVEGRMVRR